MTAASTSSTPRSGEVAVLGAGVVGLTTALGLLDAGFPVLIYAREKTPQLTSDVAAAIWLPYKVESSERADAWARRTRVLYEEMERRGVPGIKSAPLLMLTPAKKDPAALRSLEPKVRDATAAELPAGFATAPVFSVPRVETPVHMAWLQAEFARRGGRFVTRSVERVQDLLTAHRIVVNCTGVGARTVAPDDGVYPIRGQLVLVSRPAGLDDTIILYDNGSTTYIVPRDRDCVLGGTAEAGEWSTVPDPAVANDIFDRCVRLRPVLATARVLGQRVGLRPARASVRLELEPMPGGRAIVHNYGHGGAGFTLAWACAETVLELVRAFPGGR